MVDRPRILLVATRSADRHVGGSAMRAETARRGLTRVGDVTYALIDEHPADLPGAEPDPAVVTVSRRAGGLPHRWPALRALVGGRGRLADRAAAGSWATPPGLAGTEFDLAWVVKSGALLAWPGALPPHVVLDVDDLEEDTRRGLGGRSGIARLDALATRGLRRRLADQADRLVVCTTADAERLPPQTPRAVVPNAAPRVGRPTPPAPEPRLLFVGVLGYPPNRDGLVWFVREVLPMLRRQTPDVRLRVVGPGAGTLPADVRAAVETTGTVADLAEHYAWCRLVVVPVRVGSGTRVKILDAFAYGRGVVSTGLGAAGLGLRPGTDIELADSPADLAAACLRALRPGRAEDLAAAGLAVANGRLSAEAVEGQVAAVAREVLAAGRRVGPSAGSGRLWVDISSVHSWTGTPHGIARVEAGLAHGIAHREQTAAAVWLRHGRVCTGTAADLVAVSDGRDSTRPGFDAEVALPSPTRLGRLRTRSMLVVDRASIGTTARDLYGTGVGAAVAVRDRGRALRVRRQWAAIAGPDDVVVVAGNDWVNGTVPALMAIPPGRRPHLWVVVHDLLPMLQPESVPDRTARERFTTWVRQVTATADGIVTISAATAAAVDEAVARGLVARPRRVVVVPPAVDLPAASRRPAVAGRLTDPYVVYVGTVEVRKNHEVLARAVRLAAERGIDLPTVVWLGSWGWGVDVLRAELADDGALRERIVHLDGLPDDEMRWVVEHAAAAVFPSRLEGFGLPVAEARALGVPLIASDIPAVREAAGDVGLFLDPDDVTAWCEALAEVRRRPPARTVPPPEWTWDDVAVGLLDVLGYGGGLKVEPPT